MSDFSRLPQDELKQARERGYLGIYFEQGVPILDRDLNLMQDLVATTVRSIVRRYIGDGIPPGGQGFQVKAIPADNDFLVAAGSPAPGTCLVGGIEVKIDADRTYSGQPWKPPALTTYDGGATATGDGKRVRIDAVYLDVFLETVEPDADELVHYTEDVGVRTSVRLLPAWRVRVAEDSVAPPDPVEGHAHHKLAHLVREPGIAAVGEASIVDRRQMNLNLDGVERRLRQVEEMRLAPAFISKNEFTPHNAEAGGMVQIFGRNLDVPGATVQFGNVQVPAADVTLVSPLELDVKVPQGVAVGRVPITVTTAGGTVVSTQLFTVRGPAPPPELHPPEFNPTSGVAGTEVTLTGKNLDAGPVAVAFGSVDAAVTFTSAEKLIVKVPAGVSGSVNVTVTTAGGPVLSKGSFVVVAGAAPELTAGDPFTPRSSPVGGQVTISGVNLDRQPVRVLFGTVQAPVDSVAPNQITTRVPDGVSGQFRITVSTGAGSVVSDIDFKVRPA
jgi:IPT/TIG domain